MKTALMIISCFALAGCIHTLDMPKILQPLIGQDIHVAMGRLGNPSSQRQVLDYTVYTWSTVGAAMATPTTPNRVMVSTPYCVIVIGTDPQGTIRTANFNGNAGCSQYARALSP